MILQSANHKIGKVGRDHWKSSDLLAPAQTGPPRTSYAGPCPYSF